MAFLIACAGFDVRTIRMKERYMLMGVWLVSILVDLVLLSETPSMIFSGHAALFSAVYIWITQIDDRHHDEFVLSTAGAFTFVVSLGQSAFSEGATLATVPFIACSVTNAMFLICRQAMAPAINPRSIVEHGWPAGVTLAITGSWALGRKNCGLAEVAVTGAIYWVILTIIARHVEIAQTPGIANTRVHAHRHLDQKKSTALDTYIAPILAVDDSRQIFYFLLLNLSFMFVQMLYGIWSNSLGLVSDSIHMAFDCLALAVGLLAAVMSKWPSSAAYPYGFAKMEVLSGFANAIFLVLISISIVFEAIDRLSEPPEMNTDKLLLVSALGLGVNLVGIFAFNHGHAHGHSHGGHSHGGHSHGGHSHSDSHGHGHSHNHDHSHEHSHAQDSHSHSTTGGHDHHHDHDCHHDHAPTHNHSHAGHSHHGHDHNHNMQGIFLHILADTMGSVGVIVSTLLIKWTGWTGWDPVASLMIAFLITVSVLPLIASSGKALLITLSQSQEHALRDALADVSIMKGVLSYSEPRFYPIGENLSGSVKVKVGIDGDLETVREKVEKKLRESVPGLKELVVQVERGV
ncbi:cation efflux protein [Saitoella complicata NRRL Y-17804]|nr:cation efflux protein [Saitoella complicata NRRL Y-17804]ODQ51981.1 cation efflux protein [Saitoella complicata NRRL Y-17804]